MDPDLTTYLAGLDAARAERLAAEAQRIEAALADFDFLGTAESVITRYERPVWPEAQTVLDLLRVGSRDRAAYQEAAKTCYHSGVRRDGWQSTTYVGMAFGALAYGMVEALDGRGIRNRYALLEMIQRIDPVPDHPFALRRAMRTT